MKPSSRVLKLRTSIEFNSLAPSPTKRPQNTYSFSPAVQLPWPHLGVIMSGRRSHLLLPVSYISTVFALSSLVYSEPLTMI